MKKWKYALSAAPEAPDDAPILLTGDICTCLRNAASLGYDAIEYHTRETADLPYDEIIRTMQETGCRISMIVTGRIATQGGLHLVSDDPEKERACVEGFHRYVDMASKLGAGLVIGWAKGNVHSPADLPLYYERLAHNLGIIERYAAEKCVPIVIEVINHYEVSVFQTADLLMKFLAANDLPNCKAHLDSFHMFVEEVDIHAAIDQCSGRLGYVHLADYGRYEPGHGKFDFESMLKHLDEIGYDGYLAIECKHIGDRMETARKGIEYLKQLEQNL